MMKIIVPDTVQIVTAFSARPNQFHILSFIFRHQNDGTLTGDPTGRSADGADDALVRVVVDAFRRVEAKSIEVELLDPVAPVRDKKLSHWS